MAPRTASRLAWSIGISSIALMVGSLALMFVDRNHVLPAGASSDGWSFSNALNGAVNIVGVTIAIVLASKRSDNRIGWLLLLAGFCLGLNAFGTSYGLHALVVDPGSLPAGRAFAWLGGWVQFIPLGVLLFFFLLFPTGRLRSARWRPVAWFVGGTFAVVTTTLLVFSARAWNDPYGPSPQGGAHMFLFFLLVLILPLITSFVACLTAVVVRFRGSVADERLQLKWFAAAAVFVAATFIVGFFAGSNTPAVLLVLQSLAFMFLWTAIAVAILKYRLYEIDVVINKAVVYGTLAVFITLVYVGLVVGFGTIVGDRASPLLSAVAAAVIAVAFQPVRDRSRRFANRMVYGKRATPYEVLSDFAERMAGTYSTDEVLPRTARMLAEGTGAVRADVWLLVVAELRAGGSWPPSENERIPLAHHGSIEVPGAAMVAPVSYQGELLGALSMHKSAGDPMTSTDEKLVADVAAQAGLVLRNARLIEELRASRQRIVAAQDAAARRLERNIHDGAQQQLVALAVKLNLAGSLVGKNPEQERAIIDQLKAEAMEALENLRDLARGIYPPLLADQGLAVALQAQTRKAALPVELETDTVSRYRPETEAAVYFSVLEGLQNAAKYAGASQATIRLAQVNGTLTFEVADDGHGFDASAATSGTGLQGIADRLAALDGTLVIRSTPGAGTSIRGTVPV